MQQATSVCAALFSLLSSLFFVLLTSSLALLSSAAHSQTSQKDNVPIVDLHSRAFVLYRLENVLNSDYVLALGKYKKRNNRWRPDKLVKVTGSLSRYTMELPKGYLAEEAFDYYVKQLPPSAQSLFRCEQRACGESNNWANEHFQIKQLYGLNESQYYGVFTFTHANSQHYATIYSVRRGNRRLYVQLDIIAAENHE